MTRAAATAMIALEGVTFRYPSGTFSLAIPQLQVAPQSTTAIIGPSGSGKTTLLHLIAGILTPTEGMVRVGETVVSELDDSARRRFRAGRVGQVFQDFALIEYLNVRENILLPYFIQREPALSEAVRTRAQELAVSLGIGALLGRRVTRLSHGERQRVALCRALLPNPPLLLADEPTGNLDPATKLRLLDLLLEQTRLHESTLVMVTHDHQLLERFDAVVDFTAFIREA